MKSSAKSSSKTSNLPSPWTSSVFRRTTAFAASVELTLLISLPLFMGSVSPCVHPEFREQFDSRVSDGRRLFPYRVQPDALWRRTTRSSNLKRLIFTMCPLRYLCSDDSGLYSFTRTAQRVCFVPKAAILDRILRNSFSTTKHRIPKECQDSEGCIRDSRTC